MKNSAVSLGYLTADTSRVRAGGWTFGMDDVNLVDPDLLPDWHYFSGVHVSRTLDVDLHSLLQDCALAPDAVVGALLTWRSTWTNLRGTAVPLPLVQGHQEIEMELPGTLLGGELVVALKVVTLMPGSTVDVLAPTTRGATLWSDERKVMLDGAGTRFPIVAIDFSQSSVAEGRPALWSLQLHSEDLDANAAGALTVYLNTGHSRIASMMADPRSDAAKDLMDFIFSDIARQLIMLGVHQQGLDLDDLRDPATLGGMVADHLRSAFPDQTLPEIRRLYKEAPGDFEAVVQASSRVFS